MSSFIGWDRYAHIHIRMHVRCKKTTPQSAPFVLKTLTASSISVTLGTVAVGSVVKQACPWIHHGFSFPRPHSLPSSYQFIFIGMLPRHQYFYVLDFFSPPPPLLFLIFSSLLFSFRRYFLFCTILKSLAVRQSQSFPFLTNILLQFISLAVWLLFGVTPHPHLHAVVLCSAIHY